jgi:spoIIIJ-associated protein
MEWVETTGKTIEDAKEQALDQLGVADDDAEFEVLEEPRAGLFGLIRGEARIRARVRPTEVRPKQDRRRGKRAERGRDAAGTNGDDQAATDESGAEAGTESADALESTPVTTAAVRDDEAPRQRRAPRDRSSSAPSDDRGRRDREGDDRPPSEPVEPAAVGAAAVEFMEGLVGAFGMAGTVELSADDVDLEVTVSGDGLGLLIGPGGRTLLAVQDLARVAAQRRLGDHETRLRIDVAGYRERRREALERFARSVADQVLDTGEARAMEPMPSADRKVIHDVLATVDGVSSHSEGDDPTRRVVVTPA